MKALIYDIEIVKAIQGKNDPVLEGIEYCKGWDDKQNMGVSCVCAYDEEEKRPRIFFEDNKSEFEDLFMRRGILCGFNNRRFDNQVLAHSGWIKDMPSAFGVVYDILEQIWVALGHDPEKFTYETHAGYGLDAVCKANKIGKKTGYGGHAPVDFQQGRYGSLVDYCMNDVWMTLNLYRKIQRNGYIINPKDTNAVIYIESPWNS